MGAAFVSENLTKVRFRLAIQQELSSRDTSSIGCLRLTATNLDFQRGIRGPDTATSLADAQLLTLKSSLASGSTSAKKPTNSAYKTATGTGAAAAAPSSANFILGRVAAARSRSAAAEGHACLSAAKVSGSLDYCATLKGAALPRAPNLKRKGAAFPFKGSRRILFSKAAAQIAASGKRMTSLTT